MTDRNAEQESKNSMTYSPPTNAGQRRQAALQPDDDDYLPLPPIICRGIGTLHKEAQARRERKLWYRLFQWFKRAH
jgi:hypothetical protein